MSWSHVKLPPYSYKAKDLFDSLVDKRRELVKREYAHAFLHEREFELCNGYRFRSNERCFSKLEDNTPEKEFMLTPEIFIDNMLLSLAYGDYYYKYEKDWGTL